MFFTQLRAEWALTDASSHPPPMGISQRRRRRPHLLRRRRRRHRPRRPRRAPCSSRPRRPRRRHPPRRRRCPSSQRWSTTKRTTTKPSCPRTPRRPSSPSSATRQWRCATQQQQKNTDGFAGLGDVCRSTHALALFSSLQLALCVCVSRGEQRQVTHSAPTRTSVTCGFTLHQPWPATASVVWFFIHLITDLVKHGTHVPSLST